MLPCEHKANPVRFIRQRPYIQYMIRLPFYDFYEQKENTMNYRLQFFSAGTHLQFFTWANYAQHISTGTTNFFDLPPWYQLQQYVLTYSSVPNRRACTFINFEKKFPSAWSYFGLHIYWFRKKIPPYTSIPSCTFIGIGIFKISSCYLVAKSQIYVEFL